MDAIELLTQRSSMPKLTDPAPDQRALQLIQQAAVRVPDHQGLMPVQCQLFSGEQLIRLGQLFSKAAHEEPRFSAQDRERAGQLPLRAPLIIVVSTRYQEHPKVPRYEQYATAACSCMAMQQMCFALGYGAIWRSGPYLESAMVKAGLGINPDDDLVGFLYIGTPTVPVPIKPAREISIFSQGNITRG